MNQMIGEKEHFGRKEMPITNKRFNKDFKKKRINHSYHIHTERIKKEAKERFDAISE